MKHGANMVIGIVVVGALAAGAGYWAGMPGHGGAHDGATALVSHRCHFA